MIMFEYMSVGLPIISSDLPVLNEILTHKHNSLLVKPDDVFEWSTALNQLKESQDLSNTIGQNAYKDFKKNYTWELRAKKMINSL